MTKIVCISDTHKFHDFVNIPSCDILIHSGDFCGRGDVGELSKFLDWMEGLEVPIKLVVPGNHDVCLENNMEARKEFEKSGINLLIDTSYVESKSGLKFYGVPWTPDFYPNIWGFQRSRAPQDVWDKVPEDTDILITHGPPFGCADQIVLNAAPNLGSKELCNRIYSLPHLKAVVCGHIHGGYGRHSFADTVLINASICTEQYSPSNAPITLEV